VKLETNGDEFVLLADTTIHGFTIPAGFSTDFATIPRWALSIFGRPTRSEYQRASLLHDYLVRLSIGGLGLVDLKTAHKMFLNVLLEDGTSKVRAYLMYWAVVLFEDTYTKRRRQLPCQHNQE